METTGEKKGETRYRGSSENESPQNTLKISRQSCCENANDTQPLSLILNLLSKQLLDFEALVDDVSSDLRLLEHQLPFVFKLVHDKNKKQYGNK